MNLEPHLRRYREAAFDSDCERALRVVHEAVEAGVAAEEVIFHIAIPTLDLMVKSISERDDANLAQYFLTARIAEAVAAQMLPLFRQLPAVAGRVVLGSAWGDFHSLGKRIVAGCLRARLIEVIDLGVNVPAERFVEKAAAQQAAVIGISALMVHTATGPNGARKVRRLLEERRLAGRIRLIVGGAPFRFHPEMYKSVGADAWAADALSAGQVVEDLLHEPNGVTP